MVVHQRRFGKNFEPAIDFENYIGTFSRKPRAFLNLPYFPTLPALVHKYLKSCVYTDLKKILLILVPIIREGKISDVVAVLELSEIRSTDDFAIAYRALTENTLATESVTTPTTHMQLPNSPKLDPYTALL
ncbi:hypothetical protein FACS1894219_07880 [Clostridia bacterium]|nr:hypothetical protein FACS1894219_07880 [Clostridia bacterium]